MNRRRRRRLQAEPAAAHTGHSRYRKQGARHRGGMAQLTCRAGRQVGAGRGCATGTRDRHLHHRHPFERAVVTGPRNMAVNASQRCLRMAELPPCETKSSAVGKRYERSGNAGVAHAAIERRRNVRRR